jgi:sugar lactone lactonase YvrE
VIGQTSGEPDPQRFEEAVAELVEEGRGNGSLVASEPLLAVPAHAPTRLSFPGKIKPLPGSPKRWVVADGGHHQVVVFDDEGCELERYGAGTAGFEDGPAASATFNSPQGLIAAADAIYVADTFNHAIRRIDRATGAVTTLAGTGKRGPALRGPQPGRAAALASVWDLELLEGGRLAFCNAGSHQLGVLDLADATVRPLAGNGGESIVDGLALQAQLAQPSGLARDAEGKTLYFADSETSAIRAVDLGAVPSVRTVVGTGLFDFGHVNGPAATARLQHALGLAWLPGRIVVADSYNAALRTIDLEARTVGDVEDPPFLCEDALCLPYGEPAGVAADGPDRLLLADTNNHRIVELRVPEQRTRTWSQA